MGFFNFGWGCEFKFGYFEINLFVCEGDTNLIYIFFYIEMDAEMDALLSPRFVMLVSPGANTKSNKMLIPRRILDAFGDDLPATIVFELPNGRKTRVKFDREEVVFKNIRSFFGQFKQNYGICAMLTYKGHGTFMVNVMNEYLTEIEYDPPTYGNFAMIHKYI